ncbi:hypothetical protein [Streptomyces sp. SID13031]|uniref:hypothetical protein n=1 Tax=Streptomyces sp. SID13031 TaxID=2706046 RepID=UPI001942B773|nr:hypothetical protein [Streptomyces sp. SID13031]
MASTCFAYAATGRGFGLTVGFTVGVAVGADVGWPVGVPGVPGVLGVPEVLGVLDVLGVLEVLGVPLGVVLGSAVGLLDDGAEALGVPEEPESAATSAHPVNVMASRAVQATRPRPRDTIPLSVGTSQTRRGAAPSAEDPPYATAARRG